MTPIILIPSYEPNEKLPKLVKELCGDYGYGVLVVNDGSAPAFAPFFEETAKIDGCTVVGYEKNGGKGHALKYGFTYIKEHFPDCNCVVTADSDGQHKPADIKRVADAVMENPRTLVLGARDCLQDNVPARSRFGNRVTRGVFRLIAGYRITDTQTGLRGFDREAYEAFLDTEGDRFEYEMRVLTEAKPKGVKIIEIPIETVYEADRTTHFSTFRDSARVYSVFFGHIVKYAGVAILCVVVEWFLYCLLYSLLTGKGIFTSEKPDFLSALTDGKMLLSFAVARVLSAVLNYTLNRKAVFRSHKSLLSSALEYALLVLCVAACTYLLISLLSTIGLGTFFAYPVATLVMFFVSYFVQKKWIFKKGDRS